MILVRDIFKYAPTRALWDLAGEPFYTFIFLKARMIASGIRKGSGHNHEFPGVECLV